MAIKQTLWLTRPEAMAKFLAAETQEERFACCYKCDHDYDMSEDGWIKVGEAQAEVSFNPPAEIYQGALQACAAQEATIRADAEKKLRAIQDFKQTLLALEAPK